MMRKLLGGCTAIAMAFAAGQLWAGEQTETERGAAVFQEWCVPCHGIGPGHPGTQALEHRYKGASPGALEQRTDLSPEIVKAFVRNGISVMPFFRKTEISDTELEALGTYLSRTGAR